MDNLHKELYKKLEQADRDMVVSDLVRKDLHNQIEELNETIDDLTAKLDKVTAERDGLYSDLDAMEKENIMLRARVSELEEQNNPHNTEFSADMDMACDIPMKA